jgi:hypothetical protein
MRKEKRRWQFRENSFLNLEDDSDLTYSDVTAGAAAIVVAALAAVVVPEFSFIHTRADWWWALNSDFSAACYGFPIS